MTIDNPQIVIERKAALATLRERRTATEVELRAAEIAVANASEALALTGDAAAIKAFNDASSNMAMQQARLVAFDEQVIPRAEAAVIEAQSAEAEAERWRIYEEAKAAAEAAADDLRLSFGPLKDELTRLQSVMRSASTLVERANDDLPFGAERLRDPEGSVRDQWPRGVHVLSEGEEDRWVYKATGYIVPDSKLDRIEPRGPFDGLIYTGSRPRAASVRSLNNRSEVVKVRCRRREVLSQLRWVQGRRLAAIDLGPLTVEATLEPNIEYEPIDPAAVVSALHPITERGDVGAAD